jgi:chromosome segregation ATPase
MLAPLSMKEVVAERDLLRAEHALEQHRLEQRYAALQNASARYRADLGRLAANLAAVDDTTDALKGEIAGLRGEADAREHDILALQGDLGASRIVLNEFSARLERASSEIASLRGLRIALETAADDQRTTIAGLETRAAALEMKLSGAMQTAKSNAAAAQAETTRLSSELAARAKEVARLNAELGEALAKGAIIVADLEKKNSELAQTHQRLAEIEAAAVRERARADAGQGANGDADSRTQGDLALREAIARLAADVAQLNSSATDTAQPRPTPGKTRRRETAGPSSQGRETVEGAAASASLRQLQPTAPQR